MWDTNYIHGLLYQYDDLTDEQKKLMKDSLIDYAITRTGIWLKTDTDRSDLQAYIEGRIDDVSPMRDFIVNWMDYKTLFTGKQIKDKVDELISIPSSAQMLPQLTSFKEWYSASPKCIYDDENYLLHFEKSALNRNEYYIESRIVMKK